MRAAYRKIFMCVDANAVSLEERLAEVVLFVFVYFFEAVLVCFGACFLELRIWMKRP